MRRGPNLFQGLVQKVQISENIKKPHVCKCKGPVCTPLCQKKKKLEEPEPPKVLNEAYKQFLAESEKWNGVKTEETNKGVKKLKYKNKIYTEVLYFQLNGANYGFTEELQTESLSARNSLKSASLENLFSATKTAERERNKQKIAHKSLKSSSRSLSRSSLQHPDSAFTKSSSYTNYYNSTESKKSNYDNLFKKSLIITANTYPFKVNQSL